MKTVELRTAYVWDCDACGRENFKRSIVVELSPEDVAELRQEHGVNECATGDFVTIPETVICPHCGHEFATERTGF